MRVLITERERIHEQVLKTLKERECIIDFGSPDLLSETNEKALQEADVLLVFIYTKITKEVLEKAKNLKAVISFSAGLDHIDMKACREKNIKVYHSPGSNANAVAEHTIGLLFTVLKKLVQADAHVREGKWKRSEYMSHEIAGKVLGIVGFGAIGKLVAKKMSGFEVSILVYDPLLSKEQVEKSRDVKNIKIKKVGKLEELLRESDFVTIHAPLMPETENLIDEKKLQLMKPHSILINTSRGGLIDEDALVTALKEGRLYGAGLDVFKEEPLKDEALKCLDNVILTPHIAAHTKEAHENMGMIALQAFLEDFDIK